MEARVFTPGFSFEALCASPENHRRFFPRSQQKSDTGTLKCGATHDGGHPV